MKKKELKKDKKQKVVTFGEIMLRLAPEGYLRFLQARRFEASYGGGEANVAVSLANYGFESLFVTKLAENEIGQAAVNVLRSYGVDTSCIVRGGERTGIYFVEKGASQRPSRVIYDRANSALCNAKEEEFDWKEVFRGAQWFHFTGITPALSDPAAQLCLNACREAKKAGVKISCDLNYRSRLWSREKAGLIMGRLCEYVDVCIANEEDAADVFGIRAADTDVSAGEVNREGYREVAAALMERFGFEKVAITLRESVSASDNYWSGMLYNGSNCYFSRKYKMHIVDRVGGGDSFSAGLIAADLNGYDEQGIIEFAAGASCLKHTIEGDFNLVSEDEVCKLVRGDGSGRVQR